MTEGFTPATWFAALAPLAFSPGPANVLFAATGAAFGFKASLPFQFGTLSVSMLQSTLVGFGIAAVVTESQRATALLKWAGVIVLLYFAVRFFRSDVGRRAVAKPLGFKEGVLLQLFNGKFLLIPTLMFSLFLRPDSSAVASVLSLVAALAALTLTANLLWIAGGKALASVLEQDGFTRYQGIFFGSILLATAAWIGIR